MSVKKAIRFRFLAAQLRTQETHLFVNRLIDIDKNIIVSALFHQMVSTPITHDQSSTTDDINDIISNIILSRQNKPKVIQTQNVKLDQIPQKLIGVISSFLYQYEYIDFSQTNRFIYLGCNTPNSLQSMNICSIKNYANINLSLFSSLKSLRLNMQQFEQLMSSLNNLPQLNGLESIQIYGKNKKMHAIIDDFKLNNVKTIQLTSLSFNANDHFLKLLKQFPNVKYLCLNNVLVDCNLDRIKHIYPNLKGLFVCGYDDAKLFCRKLVNAFGSGLSFLKLVEYKPAFDYGFKNTNFHQLKQLQLHNPTNKSIREILSTAANLEKICIDSRSQNRKKPPVISSNNTKEIFGKVITACKLLKYIEFHVHFSNGFPGAAEMMISAMEGIQQGLFATMDRKRDTMKVAINVWINRNGLFDALSFISNIAEITNQLDNSDIKHFMFILKLPHLNNKIDRFEVLKQLQSKCLSVNTQVNRIGNYFVTTNRNCSIEGVFESWEWC